MRRCFLSGCVSRSGAAACFGHAAMMMVEGSLTFPLEAVELVPFCNMQQIYIATYTKL